jgi:glyoxylase-like metal-dependent hydrolase (beta-lactamase superfamily II)
VGSLADHDVVLIRADNPSPLTLTGTNTWFVSGWVIDPGPALDAHLDAVAAAGDVEGIAITHDHEDHVEGLDGLLRRVGDVPVVSARSEHTGPLEVVPLPGHSDDSVAFVAGRAAFVGDAVLGEGSVFVTGQLAAYLDGLRELRKHDLAVLCPGHGPPIWDVRGKLDEYIAHRLDREERLLAALDRGLRSEDELLDAAWDDAPEELRPFAAVSLRAHLEKLRAEGRA